MASCSRRPASVASIGSSACVALRGPQLDPVERAEGAEQVAAAVLEGLLGELVVAGGAAHLGGQIELVAALQAGGVLGVDGGADLAQEATGSGRPAPPRIASSWSHSTGVRPTVTGAPSSSSSSGR